MLTVGYHYQGTYYGHGSGPRRLSYGCCWYFTEANNTASGIFHDDDYVGDGFFHVGCAQRSGYHSNVNPGESQAAGTSGWNANQFGISRAGIFMQHCRTLWSAHDLGCINSSTGYHYVPSMYNHQGIIVAHTSDDSGIHVRDAGVFYCDWWGRVVDTHPTVGCLNSPNYYLQKELSLSRYWR